MNKSKYKNHITAMSILLGTAVILQLFCVNAHAGFKDFINKTRESVGNARESVGNTREAVSSRIDEYKSRTKESISNSQQKLEENNQIIRERISDKVNKIQRKVETVNGRIDKENFSDKVDSVRQSAVEKSQSVKDWSNDLRQRAHSSGSGIIENTGALIKEKKLALLSLTQKSDYSYFNRNTINRLNEAFSKRKESGKAKLYALKKRIISIKDMANSLSPSTRELLKSRISVFGDTTQTVAEAVTSRYGSNAATVINRSASILNSDFIRSLDDDRQQRIVYGILTAAGTGYALYNKRDAVAYAVIDRALSDTPVKTGKGNASIKTLYGDMAVSLCPALKGSSIATDPAQSLAMVLTGASKEEILTKMAIIPEGDGHYTSIAEKINQVDGGDQAIALLSLSGSLEDAALSTTASGRLGPQAEAFSVAYQSTVNDIDDAKH
jgi:hypothetical protein